MSVKVGRNDPCPCGSGKKFKKCCLHKEVRETFPTAQQISLPPELLDSIDAPGFVSAEAPTPGPEGEPLTEEEQQHEQRWQEFVAADYPKQIELFQDGLRPDTEYGDLVLGMIHELFHGAVRHGDHDRFARWVDQVRQVHPALFEEDRLLYLQLLFWNAVAAEDFAAVRDLTPQLVPLADYADSFSDLCDCLAYHGQLTTLLELLRAGWSAFRDNEDVLPWTKFEHQILAIQCELCDYLKTTPHPDPGDPDLWERVNARYGALDRESFVREVAHLFGVKSVQWTERHSDLLLHDSDDDEEDDKMKETLSWLGAEFFQYAVTVEGVPFTKATLARDHLCRYLVFRRVDSPPNLGKLWGAVTPKDELWKMALCPDRKSLDSYLAKKLSFPSPLYYRGAVVFELTPTWLRFLQHKGLLSAAGRDCVLQQLRPLYKRMLKVWQEFRHDPALARGLEGWGEDEESSPQEVEP